MRVVLDTNIFISGLNFSGNERLVLELARRGRFELYLSPFILQETVGVLTRKFGWSEERSTQALQILRGAAVVIEPQRILSVIENHQADNQILACALEASADYLITGDRRHLLPLETFRNVRIISASQFLSLLDV
ncbi:MAG: putative toxin-antitoxin system toxin component, PIN family [Caldilineaceae bacterium SB0664_bin_27]|uniref:Putative toxin-antitoxin system toxin component, PIN family n=1 Tax=Caldilineaceae bacterium SB0664_bin_27 TaxID=2605260 RepID=A0A6B0YTT7_9CHLR|nr:putative toxin-antitoxin system toxin component, PIN family [Caldilineaceae bacterium SB0664_bin_27]